MPPVPGLLTMPTVLLNAALSVVGRSGLPVRGPDTIAVVSPMYNEARGAARALASVLEQSVAPDQLVVSINGATDATRAVVLDLLRSRGYLRDPDRAGSLAGAALEGWFHPRGGPDITLAQFGERTAKSDSLNLLVAELVHCDRVLVIDGDTVLDRRFIETMRDSFYRLEQREDRFVLEDSALQSGAVMSFAPRGSGVLQRLISLGRRAEYAFAGVLRRGQTATFGGWEVFARSRLFTVVGCGFVARRDLFPIPNDTMTEDHDFTLAVQSRAPETSRIGGEALAERGFRVLRAGRELSPASLVGCARNIEVVRSGEARFVGRALMLTEDPPHLNGLFRQVERWNGGAIENVLKRLLEARQRREMSPNVRFALWTSQFEHLLGLLLLTLIPVLVALNVGTPTLGMPWSTLLAWLGFDLAFGALLTGYGFWLYHRAAGRSRLPSGLRTVGEVALTLLPFMALKYLNPLAYLAGAISVVPRRLRPGRVATRRGVSWERPGASTPTRTPLLFRWVVVVMSIVVLSVAQVSSKIDPVNREIWTILQREPRIEMAMFESVPLVQRLPPENEVGLSHFCAPSFVRSPASEPQRLADESIPYQPLSPWELLILARLAPLAPLLEEAATAYDVPLGLLLQVLLNESYLDPLAVGPTGDKGLSQMTSDALTMLRALSNDRASKLYNPRLVPASFHIFDPDFSICAGSAKLAWALDQPGGHSPAVAYALYINPVRGAPRGQIDPRHEAAVAAMLQLGGLVDSLRAVYAAADRGLGSPAEQELIAVSAAVAAGELTLPAAYARSRDIARRLDLGDTEIYERVLEELFGPPHRGGVATALRR